MIASIEGTITKKTDKGVIVDTGNIGYFVALPSSIHENLKEKEEAFFYIDTRVREDDISLYGFETWEQIELFKAVTSISGVGPKIGLELLSSDPEKIKAAIVNKDVEALTKVPGIGKKSAERLIVELKNKVDWDITTSTHQGLGRPEDDDAVQAIMGLGYHKHEVKEILKKMPEDITTPEEVVAYFLQNV